MEESIYIRREIILLIIISFAALPSKMTLIQVTKKSAISYELSWAQQQTQCIGAYYDFFFNKVSFSIHPPTIPVFPWSPINKQSRDYGH